MKKNAKLWLISLEIYSHFPPNTTTLVMKVIAAKMQTLQQSLIRIIVTHQFSLRLSHFNKETTEQLAYLVKSNLTVVAGPTAIL